MSNHFFPLHTDGGCRDDLKVNEINSIRLQQTILSI